MNVPECNKSCENHFHHTQGRHLTTCDLHKFDEISELLDTTKMWVWTGNKILNKEWVDLLNKQLLEFIND